MNRLLVLMLQIFFISVRLFSQEPDRFRLCGQVTDAFGRALPFVSVIVDNGIVKTGCATESKGRFDFDFQYTDSASVYFSMLGYETVRRNLRLEDSGRDMSVVMRENGVGLAEVNVFGSTVIAGNDNIIYIPNGNQVRGSDSGYDLLFAMALPQLRVNKVTREIVSSTGDGVACYIDGFRADGKMLGALRPKDVARVEYYDNGGDIFPGQGRVVNFVLRKPDKGGYVALKSETSVGYLSGVYTAQATFNTGAMTYSLLAGTDFSNDDKVGNLSAKSYGFANPFDMYATTVDGLLRQRDHYAFFQAQYSKGNTYAFLRTGLDYIDNPEYSLVDNVAYSRPVCPSAVSLTGIRAELLSPSLNAYLKTNLADNHVLMATLDFNYTHNAYDRSYVEGAAEPIVSENRENLYELVSQLTYYYQFNRHRFGVQFYSAYRNSAVDYFGSLASRQRVSSLDMQLLPQFVLRYNKLTLMTQLGAYLSRFEDSSIGSRQKWFVRPQLIFNYFFDKTKSFNSSFVLGNSEPSLAQKNDAEQYVNAFEMVRGNPELDYPNLFMGNIGFTHNLGSLTYNIWAKYEGVYDYIASTYSTEGDMMVRSFGNVGDFHSFDVGIGASQYLFGRKVQLYANLAFKEYFSRGKYHDTKWYLDYYLMASWFHKGFSVNGFFQSKIKTLLQDIAYQEVPCFYGVSASMGIKGWYIEAGAVNLFEGLKSTRNYYDYGVYKFNTDSFSAMPGRRFYFKLSYNFDFGKTVDHEEMRKGKTSTSGMLKL